MTKVGDEAVRRALTVQLREDGLRLRELGDEERRLRADLDQVLADQRDLREQISDVERWLRVAKIAEVIAEHYLSKRPVPDRPPVTEAEDCC